jgi:hypothetical protein
MEDFIRSLPWDQVYLFLQAQKRLHTEDERQVRRFFEGVCLVLRSGMQWRFLPPASCLWLLAHRSSKIFKMETARDWGLLAALCFEWAS